MKQLTIPKRGISPEIKGIALEIIQAREGVVRIKELKMKDIQNSLLEIIIRSHHRVRYALPKDNELRLMAEIFAQDVSSYGGTVTLQEIDIACRNGCNGLYGEFIGLSNATFIKWVMSYIQSEERKLAIKKQQEYLKGSVPEPTQEEKDRLSHEAYMECFNQYKTTGKYIFLSAGTYDYLDRTGVIKYTKEEKWAAMEQAKEQILGRLQDERLKGASPYRAKEISGIIEQLRTSNDPAIDEAKKILLNKYFDSVEG